MRRRTIRLGELSERDRVAVESDLAQLDAAKRQLRAAQLVLERAARGRASRSATRLAKKLLRTLTEVTP